MGIFNKNIAPVAQDGEQIVSDVPDLATVRATNAALMRAREIAHRDFLKAEMDAGKIIADKQGFLDSGQVDVITPDMERPSVGPEPQERAAS